MFKGNLYIFKDLADLNEISYPAIIFSAEAPESFEMNSDCLRISSLPLKMLNDLENRAGFYENLLIESWLGAIQKEEYLPNITYGFECFSSIQSENVLHALFRFDSFNTFLIYAPTDPQLDLLSLNLARFIRRYQRIKETRRAVRGGGWIQKQISENIRNSYLSGVFQKVGELGSGKEVWDDMESLSFMTTKSFEIFSIIITFI
ncbi:unnamed protein product [Blepharisma stoltei]|uniref:Maturase K n=1 Tax=Blepharisma stoltei TaxID=1481888 RepID=A0AAU9J3H7_9CILI|nr:unnamed protein product [Blepharisma stoltei]